MLETRTLQRIRNYLAGREELIAAYLFGSVAQGLAHRHSDIDIALLLTDASDQLTIFEARLEMAEALERICRQRVDVIVLNQAPPFLRFQVFKQGHILFERDKDKRCLFQMRTYNEYYDFKPYLDYQLSHLVKRIRKDGLGHGYRGDRDPLAEARRLREKFAALGEGAAG